MLKKITLGGRDVTYVLIRKKVKNLNLRIKPDLKIYVSASPFISETAVENFLVLKTDFILNALDRLSALYRQPLMFISGETVEYLGSDIELSLEENSDDIAYYDGKLLHICVSQPDDYDLKKKVFEKWQREQCEKTVILLCNKYYPCFSCYGISFPTLRFRKMKSRWGSCNPNKGILTFNSKLITAPIKCIEYVVVHEFSHFLVPNHSEEFYRKIQNIMPDWKCRQKTLKNILIIET